GCNRQSMVHDRMSQFNSIKGLLLGVCAKEIETINGHDSEVKNNTNARQQNVSHQQRYICSGDGVSSETEGLHYKLRMQHQRHKWGVCFSVFGVDSADSSRA
ncbi:hypothetical protein A2U01_0028601, partial [Trifolium medium]|nr:hypothetical protein [Trifolium medium]